MLQDGVAHERERLPGQLAAVLLDGEQVGEGLARVELVGERVHDGYAGVLGHHLEPLLLVGPPDHQRGLPSEHAGGVGDRLADADLRERAVDDHREATELGDARGEGRLRAERRLVEEHRHGAGGPPAASRRTATP